MGGLCVYAVKDCDAESDKSHNQECGDMYIEERLKGATTKRERTMDKSMDKIGKVAY